MKRLVILAALLALPLSAQTFIPSPGGGATGTNTGDQVVPANEAGTASNWLRAYNSTTGAWTKSRPACADLSDSAAGCTNSLTLYALLNNPTFTLGTTTPDLYFNGTTTTGLHLKSLTTAQRDAVSPAAAAGDTIYNSTTGRVEMYDGSLWHARVRLDGDAMTGTLTNSVSFSAPLHTAAAGTTLAVTATAPTVAATTTAGTPATVTASAAVAGNVTAGAAAGGDITITSGAAARLTSGNANGGNVAFALGAGIGTGTQGAITAGAATVLPFVMAGGYLARMALEAQGAITGAMFYDSTGSARVLIYGNGVLAASNRTIGFCSSAILNACGDSAFSRIAAGIIGVGTGAALSTAGSFQTSRILAGSLTPTVAVTTGFGSSPSVAVDTGSTDLNGIYTITTGTGATITGGDITVTFSAASPYGTNTPACVAMALNGASAWSTGVTARGVTQSPTAVRFTLTDGGGFMTASTTYKVNLICMGK